MNDVKVDNGETVKGTVSEFQEIYGVDDYTVVSGFLKFLECRGIAKNAGSRKSPSGKGKPSIVWEIPKSFTLNTEPLPAKNDHAA